MAEEDTNLEKQFLSGSLSEESYRGKAEYYSGSSFQRTTYENLINQDSVYKQFIANTYGSYENFKTLNKVFQKGAVYDPTIDYMLDVTVITEDRYYKTDHISSSEIIFEAMSGICSFYFTKLDGSTTKVNGTLESKYISGAESERRQFFFSPLKNERIVVWDINKQKWSSFFMNNLFKFVRDDTIDIE